MAEEVEEVKVMVKVKEVKEVKQVRTRFSFSSFPLVSTWISLFFEIFFL